MAPAADVADKPTSTGSPKEATDILGQENVSARSITTRQASKVQQVRHRASVACASCRDRRIRCVVPKGENCCTACQRSGTECLIQNDDQRRKPISKAYMSSLSTRIEVLESMLMEQGVVPPPAVHPPRTRQDAHLDQPPPQEDSSSYANPQTASHHLQQPVHMPQRQHSPTTHFHNPMARQDNGVTPPESGNEDFFMHDSDNADSHMANSQTFFYRPPPKEQSPFRNLDPKNEDLIHRLLSTKGNLSFDQLSGRVRVYGPTANSHVFADQEFDTREPPEQVRRAERIIRSLTTTTHDYLMNLFWEHYNGILHIIDRAAFEADRDSQNPRLYSSFLHITILAMGYRFCDPDRDDMKRISLGNRESSLHRESKYMMDIELERPGGIPSVQALLVLGDLECGAGRDNTGWMYSGMANRLAFDIGLHLDSRQNPGISEQEIQNRALAMRACVIYDKYWALFLGRPTSIKSQDLSFDLLSQHFGKLLSDPSTGASYRSPRKDLSEEIYDQLTELMEIAGRIAETRNTLAKAEQQSVFSLHEGEDNSYMHVVNLDRQLTAWYKRLPSHLSWTPPNIKSAPFSFFLLHQQYHVSMILLHRPWAKYPSIHKLTSDGANTNSYPSPASDNNAMLPPEVVTGEGLGEVQSIVDESRTSLSRGICTQQAIRVARIFAQHRTRFDPRKIFVTGIQHAGTAAIALIAALAYHTNMMDKRAYLGYLEILASSIKDMAHTYQPAAKMNDLLTAVLGQLRADIGDAPIPSTGFGSMAGSGASLNGWQASPDSGSIYGGMGLIPQRREPDSDHSCWGKATKKRRHTAQSRRASEFNRPGPPFFATTSNSVTTGSNVGGHHPASSYSSMGMPGTIPGLFGAGDIPHAFSGLDFMSGSAIEEAMPTHVRADAPGWGLGNLTGHPGGSGFELPVAEWGATNGVNSETRDTGNADSQTKEKTQNDKSQDKSERDREDQEGNQGDGKPAEKSSEANRGGEWMAANEPRANELIPISLGGLANLAEKVAGVPREEVKDLAKDNDAPDMEFFGF
ncbi:Nitrogen assimilation transcription factor nirA [Zalerion maritima]|uniref:Nitrogen assimilation transcription factor nirA n=1 Tax=Zalerion maritima TaxID=339359 RepID=A0AAD5RJS5_9PEZI|nr:Nitrogen assimilation transcription factor nirA [Zalerion maritima]